MTGEAFEDGRMLGLVAWLHETANLSPQQEYIVYGTENVRGYYPRQIAKMGAVEAAKNMLDDIDQDASEFRPYEERSIYMVRVWCWSTGKTLATYRMEKEVG